LKRLINRPGDAVDEMVDGLVAIHPGLWRLAGRTVLVRADSPLPRDRVALVSGGGSGHEPAHAGYIGPGMLSAAVAGKVFTSPPPDAILAAIRAVARPGGAGVLLIVKNYTGDRLNFGLAAELARAAGIAVGMVVVADDVALAAGGEHAGRRGIAGTVLVHKIAGAAAEAGLPLVEVAAEARAAAAAVRSMGVGLSACTIPGADKPGFDLAADEIELGLGIHGEPGVKRLKHEPANALVERLLDAILADQRPAGGDRVALLINNLGGTTTMELAVVGRHAVNVLEERHGLHVERVYAGTFLSALEMAGVSLSLISLDDRRLARLDAPATAPGWPNAAAQPRARREPIVLTDAMSEATTTAPAPRTLLGRCLGTALRAVAGALLAAESRLNELDRIVGDGDIGTSLARGADELMRRLPLCPLDDPAKTLEIVGQATQHALGGTSGPLYAVLCLRAASRLRGGPLAEARHWARAFRDAVEAVAELGDARPGDRTMLDSLVPASDAFARAIDSGEPVAQSVRAAARAAHAGAEATAGMLPRKGRSSYLASRALGHVDPGAYAVVVWLSVLAEAIEAPAA
jgi:dihydroxyacetone kinase